MGIKIPSERIVKIIIRGIIVEKDNFFRLEIIYVAPNKLENISISSKTFYINNCLILFFFMEKLVINNYSITIYHFM
jgi:hypothetical protein